MEFADAVRIALNQSSAARCYVRRENTMNAAESKLSLSDTAIKRIEEGNRAIGRGNRPASAAGLCDDILAAGATSIAEIEKLMADLQTTRDYLEAEGERVRRLTTRYAHLTQTASASVKIIAESLGKWRNPEPESISQAYSVRNGAPAANLVHGGEPPHERKDP